MSNDKSNYLVTPEGRAAFPFVLTQRKDRKTNEDDGYDLTLLFPPETDLSELKAAAEAVAIKEWGPDKSKWPEIEKDGKPIKKCDDVKTKSGQPVHPDCPGWRYIVCKSQFKPEVVDENVQPVISSDKIYGGCWMRTTTYPWVWECKGKHGISWNLGATQKTRDDKPFSSQVKAKDVFKPIPGAAPAAQTPTAPAAGGSNPLDD